LPHGRSSRGTGSPAAGLRRSSGRCAGTPAD
jgi:hypothetical protein